MKNLFKVELSLPVGMEFELHIGRSKKVKESKLMYNNRVVRRIITEDLLEDIKNKVKDGDALKVTLDENKYIVTDKDELCFNVGNMIFSENIILDVVLDGDKVNVLFDDILLDTKDVEHFGDLFTRVPRFNTVKRTSYKAIVKGADEISIVRYANTHQHTEYSRLDGMSKIQDIANKTEWAGAITDHGVMTGALKFESALKSQEKKPIVGIEPYIERIDEDIFLNNFVDLKELDEESSKEYRRKYFKKDHIIMLAKNNTGYHNLMKLASLSWENYYGKNHIRYSDLVNNSEGIIATTACLGSTIGRSLMEDEKEVRKAFFKELGEVSNAVNLIEIEDDIDLLQGDDLDLTTEESAILKNKFGVDKTWLSSDDIRELIKGNEDSYPLTMASFKTYMRTAHLYLKKMIAIFGKDDFYIEIQRHKFAAEEYYEKKCLELAEEYGLKIISGIDSHYLNKEDKETHEIWLCEATRTNINNPKRLRFPGEGYYLMNSDEALELFEDLQEALDNSLEVADKCNVNLKVKEYFLPKFPLPEGYDEDGSDPDAEQVRYFRDLLREGFKNRFYGTEKYTDPVYLERIKFEVGTILHMKFASYFLIVQDFIAWAKDADVINHQEKYFPKRYYDYSTLPEAVLNKDYEIYVGPGRGSAAGSLVAYCLGITNIDPIEYDLLFERFLNPDRISMPDIDTDFEDAKRELVIDYIKAKYSPECVSRIGTIGKLAAKGIIRSIQRCEAKEISLANKICKAIPNKPGVTLKSALEDSPELKEMYDKDGEVSHVIDEAMTLEGLAKTVGMHACGMLIAPSAVNNYIPQQLLKNPATGLPEATTQFAGAECEDQGILKMDFLGLRTLGVLREAIDDVNAIRDENDKINLNSIDIYDKDVYKYLSEGNTEGVFQFESAFMRSNAMQILQDINTNKKLTGRDCFNRLSDATALGRPGPMAEIPNYVAAILDNSKVKLTNTPLDDIVAPTFGIIVYQEQVMAAVKVLAGFTAGQADTVRKVMGKKLVEKLAELKEWFVNGNAEKGIPGCVNNGYSKKFAEEIWDRMAEFGKYAFNKSHSVAYTYLSAKTAWLAYYYPSIFMKATLDSFIDNNKKIKQYIAVCKQKGIKVLSPDVNKSQESFAIDYTDGFSTTAPIRFGLKGIKSLGAKSKLVIAEREANGEFTSYQDFVKRMIGIPKFDKAAIIALILAGALDEFEGTRKNKIEALEELETLYKTEAVAKRSGQMTLFELAKDLGDEELLDNINAINDIVINDGIEYETLYKLDKEKEFAGFYISAHPVDAYKNVFKREGAIEIINLVGDDSINDIETNDEVTTEVIDNEEGETNYVDETVSIAGIIKDIDIRYTKKDSSKMKTFNIEDDTESIKCVLFPKKLQEGNNDILTEENSIVFITGKLVEDESFGRQILVETVKDVKTLMSKTTTYIIKVEKNASKIQQIVNSIKPLSSDKGIKVVLQCDNKFRKICYVPENISVLNKIQQMVGDVNFSAK